MARIIKIDGLSQPQIYEDGNLYSITVEDLKDNEIAIMQLINDYNTKVKTIEKLQMSEKQLSAELQYQNVNPFFSIIATVINIIGSVISCCGVNFFTSKENVIISYVFIGVGSLLLLCGGSLTIFYKYVYKWMN